MVGKAQKQEARASILKGMDAIEQFSGFNRTILLRMKGQYPLMPMNKPDHSWLADPDELAQFLKDYAAGKTEKWLGPDHGQEQEPEASDDQDDGKKAKQKTDN